MTKCLNCGEEVKQTEGRRPRKFCDNKGKCRLAHWNKNKPKEQKYVLKSTYDKLLAEIEENNKPENKERIKIERNTVAEKPNSQYPLTINEAKQSNSSLEYCSKCSQITIHIGNNCQKCKIPPPPVKEPNEDAIDFAIRKNEWKLKYQ